MTETLLPIVQKINGYLSDYILVALLIIAALIWLIIPQIYTSVESIVLNSQDYYDTITGCINKFFENSLNVSETSRQLYIHRNTLVYRLDKIQKITGLDLRVFDDAITFKIALMVVKYMKYMESKDTF